MRLHALIGGDIAIRFPEMRLKALLATKYDQNDTSTELCLLCKLIAHFLSV
jgi:hypothetical protein